MNLDKLKDSIKDVLREEGSTEKYKVSKYRRAIYKKPDDWTYTQVGYHANLMRLRRSLNTTRFWQSTNVLNAMSDKLMAIPLESRRQSDSFISSKDEKQRVTRELHAALARAFRISAKEANKLEPSSGKLADISEQLAAKIFALAGYRIISIKNTEAQ
jgi:hypothetical protein